jgi:hypothetical protein
MDYDVLEARWVTGHTVWLRFRDGTVGENPRPVRCASYQSNAVVMSVWASRSIRIGREASFTA